jgi:hypothetical protein
VNTTLFAWILGGLLLAAPDGRIFLNGVAIDTVRGQQFTNATVRIDGEGRVHIDAPDYEVAPPAETVHLKPARLAPGEGALGVFQSLAHGKTGITVQVMVNGSMVADQLDPLQYVFDFLPQLRPGKNIIEVKLARKSGEGAMEVVLGLGGLRDSRIELTDTLVSEKVDLRRNGMKIFRLELTK